VKIRATQISERRVCAGVEGCRSAEGFRGHEDEVDVAEVGCVCMGIVAIHRGPVPALPAKTKVTEGLDTIRYVGDGKD
jgi:hypothetical protein